MLGSVIPDELAVRTLLPGLRHAAAAAHKIFGGAVVLRVSDYPITSAALEEGLTVLTILAKLIDVGIRNIRIIKIHDKGVARAWLIVVSGRPDALEVEPMRGALRKLEANQQSRATDGIANY